MIWHCPWDEAYTLHMKLQRFSSKIAVKIAVHIKTVDNIVAFVKKSCKVY